MGSDPPEIALGIPQPSTSIPICKIARLDYAAGASRQAPLECFIHIRHIYVGRRGHRGGTFADHDHRIVYPYFSMPDRAVRSRHPQQFDGAERGIEEVQHRSGVRYQQKGRDGGMRSGLEVGCHDRLYVCVYIQEIRRARLGGEYTPATPR